MGMIESLTMFLILVICIGLIVWDNADLQKMLANVVRSIQREVEELSR